MGTEGEIMTFIIYFNTLNFIMWSFSQGKVILKSRK